MQSQERILSNRQETVLSSIIDSYAEDAEPVGSRTVVELSDLEISPATIRNEMGVLEQLGYLIQPHTSAGRRPTIKAYRYYRDHLILDTAPTKEEKNIIKGVETHDAREIAKIVSQHIREAVIVGFAPSEVYYTGLTYLFSKPECLEHARVIDLSNIVDSFSEALEEFFDDVTNEISIWIGDEHPFGNNCSIIIQRFRSTKQIFAILGLERMNYAANARLVRWVCEA